VSFCHNTNQQMNIFDPFYGLTEREAKRLKNSWAEVFSSTIFPIINEDRFSVLYSDNIATRPNNPVNVYVGLLMLREIFRQSDEEALDSLMFDVRYQYALHTTSFKEQPVSKNSLTNFRSAVSRYNEEHGTDLIQEEIESHAETFSKLLNIEGRLIRMDSLMISSSCKKLSRLELVFSCLQRLIKKISDMNEKKLPEKYKAYLGEEYRNDIIYRSRDNSIDSRLKTLIEDSVCIHDLFRDTDVSKTEEYQLLNRMLNEQTHVTDGKTELVPSKEISPESLQNPSDPDATYRRKGSKDNTGYTANIVENFDDKNAVILQYDLQKNTHSDQKFSRETIDKLGKQEEEVTVIADGAYYSEDISEKAADNNINIVPTSLVGRTQSNEKGCYTGFNIDEENHIVLNCPADVKPESSKYRNGVYKAHFNKTICDCCPHRPDCPVASQKKKCFFSVSETRLHRSILIERMGTEVYKKLAKKRAGIEGVPSVLRRRYNIDHLPVRGLVISKIYLGFKVSAINCKRLIRGLRNATKDQTATAVSVYLLEVLSFQRSFAVAITA
jgi:hypothetical protein